MHSLRQKGYEDRAHWTGFDLKERAVAGISLGQGLLSRK